MVLGNITVLILTQTEVSGQISRVLWSKIGKNGEGERERDCEKDEQRGSQKDGNCNWKLCLEHQKWVWKEDRRIKNLWFLSIFHSIPGSFTNLKIIFNEKMCDKDLFSRKMKCNLSESVKRRLKILKFWKEDLFKLIYFSRRDLINNHQNLLILHWFWSTKMDFNIDFSSRENGRERERGLMRSENWPHDFFLPFNSFSFPISPHSFFHSSIIFSFFSSFLRSRRLKRKGENILTNYY